MKKKTYKQMQNRLYREIKHRLLAESKLNFPVPIVRTEERKIDTLKTRKLIPAYDPNDVDYWQFTKKQMAHAMCDKLLEDGYFLFSSSHGHGWNPAAPGPEIECLLHVVKPWEASIR